MGLHSQNRRDGRNGSSHRKGFPQLEIADAAYNYQRQIDAGEKIMIGINKYLSEDVDPIPFLEIDDKVENEQIGGLRLSAREGTARP